MTGPGPRQVAFAAIVLAGSLGAGCSDSEVGYIVAENRSDQPLLIRKAEVVYDGSGLRKVWTVLAAPVGSRIAVGTQTMTGPEVNQIDVLRDDCSLVATVLPYQGLLVRINPGPVVDQRSERPSAGEQADLTDRCDVPDLILSGPPSPSAS